MLYKLLPYFINKRLFGDRRRYGTKIIPDDPDYQFWLKNYRTFYDNFHERGVGSAIYHFGYTISSSVDLTHKTILELGPGVLEHLDYNATRPQKYILADVKKEFLEASEGQLIKYGVQDIVKIEIKTFQIPLADNQVDVIFAFHQLEHIYELSDYLRELKRVLKPSGLLVGAVPCDGGLAWGVGRYIISRRYAIKKLKLNYDKIVCWEHVNFVDMIKDLLDREFVIQTSFKKPFHFLPMDLNLSWAFIYKNCKGNSKADKK
jgi:SAM-dependent methyltransferase